MANWQDYPDAQTTSPAQIPAPAGGAPSTAAAPAWAAYPDARVGDINPAPTQTVSNAPQQVGSIHGLPPSLAASLGIDPSTVSSIVAPVNAVLGWNEQAQRAASGGLTDKVGAAVSAMNAAISKGADAVTGAIGREWLAAHPEVTAAPEPATPTDALSPGEIYQRQLIAARAAGDVYSHDHPIGSPIATTVGTVFGGGVPSATATIPAKLGAKVGQGMLAGGTIGGISGFGHADDESIGSDLLATAKGAAAGAGVGGALPVATGVLTAPAEAAARNLPFVGDANTASQAATRLAQAYAADKTIGAATAEDAGAKVAAANAAGQPLALRDVSGPNVAALGGQLLRKPGIGGSNAANFLEMRDQAAGERILNGPLAGLSPGADVYTATKQLTTQQQAASKPAYDAALAGTTPVNIQPVISNLDAEIANAKGGIKASLQQARGYLLDQNGNPDTSMVGLHQSKLAIDDLMNGANDTPIGNNARRLLRDTQGRLLDAMDTASTVPNPSGAAGAPAVSLYKVARDTFAGPAQVKDAIALGEKFTTLPPAAIQDELSNMTSSEKAGFLLGVKGNLTKAVMSKGEGGNEALAVAKNPFMKQQLSAVFSNPADYDAFIGNIENEGLMFKTKMQDAGGSQTAARVAQDASAAPTGALGHGVQAVVAAHEGAPLAAGMSGLRALGALAQGRTGLNAGVAEKLTPMMYSSSGPSNAETLARILAASRGPAVAPALTVPLASMAGAHPAAAAAAVQIPLTHVMGRVLGTQ